MTETVREARMMNMTNAVIELLTALEDGEESAREGRWLSADEVENLLLNE